MSGFGLGLLLGLATGIFAAFGVSLLHREGLAFPGVFAALSFIAKVCLDALEELRCIRNLLKPLFYKTLGVDPTEEELEATGQWRLRTQSEPLPYLPE